MKCRLAAAALALLAAACSQSAQSTSSTSSASSPVVQATNPIDFPLYSGSTVVNSREFQQKAGSRTIGGHEVIAESSATLDQLDTWLGQVSASPPSGYTLATSSSSMDSARRRAQALGVDFQVFRHTVDGQPHALVVVALDPSIFNRKAGPVLALIDRYSMLPQSLRDPIDEQVKQRTGYTVGEALDPSQPLGAALSAMKALRDSGQRGVVLVDASKQ
jgi:hypothetical protein